MAIRPFQLNALLVCGAMMSSCAGSAPTFADPPRLALPEAATRACTLRTLPEAPTQSDLDAAYTGRGADLLNCDGARKLAVDTKVAQDALVDEWVRIQRARGRPWWRPW